MDEEEKDLNKINDNYLFIFIDKAIHAASLQNSQITISISLHPSIYPLTSPPIFVKFNHVRFSFGLMLPFSEILNGEIHSISELKIQLILKENLTSRIIGKCFIPFTSNDKSLISHFEDTSIHSLDTDRNENNTEINSIDQKIDNLPYFFHQCSRFSILSPKQPKDANNLDKKIEICQVIVSIAFGNDKDKEKIIPTDAVCYEQIRIKRNYKQKIYSSASPTPVSSPKPAMLESSNVNSNLLSPNLIRNRNIIIYNQDRVKTNRNNIHFTKKDVNTSKINANSMKENNHTHIKFRNRNNNSSKSVSLTTDQIQFVIDNWKKYALQNGWSPPPEETHNQKGKIMIKKSPSNFNNTKTKFSSLMNRKLIQINHKSNNYLKNEDNDNTKLNDNKKEDTTTTTNTINYFNDIIESQFDSSNINKKNFIKGRKNKKKRSYAQYINTKKYGDKHKEHSKNESPSSVGPKRTTQYQLITDFSLDDSFLDKVQRNFNSDPPPHFSVIDDYDSFSSSTTPFDIFPSDNDYAKATQSSPEMLLNPSISVSEEFLSQNDDFRFCSSSLMIDSRKINDNSFSPNEKYKPTIPSNLSSSSSIISLNTPDYDDNINTNEKNRKICINNNDVEDITKASFESLEAMIKVPPIPTSHSSKYTITQFNNIFDLKPTIKFGKKEIISIQVFRAKPNPSEKIDTIYYSMRSNQKSKLNKEKEKGVPQLKYPSEPVQFSTSQSQMVIKKSPSLEKIFQDGHANISKLYEDSSSDD